MEFEKVSVIGLGYIGLPTAAVFASKGVQVLGVDVDEDIVSTINRGEVHIVEPELDAMVKKAVDDGFLKASLEPQQAEAFLIAVPTPFYPKDESGVPHPNLTYIESAARAIAKVLKKGDLIVLESTSPVGTTEKLSVWLAQERKDLSFPHQTNYSDICIAYCPERVLPGQVVEELISNDRIIGGLTDRCSKAAVELYKTFVKGSCNITNSKTAEMAKLSENSYRDVNIAFANELSIICDELNIDVWELIKLSNKHPRVNVLSPGPGVGGHCIAVNPWFIVSKSPSSSRLIKTARLVNDGKPSWVLEKVKETIARFLCDNEKHTIKDITVACYGLSFKPDIDDLRESPALNIAISLANQKTVKVIAVEPNIESLPASIEGNLIQLVDFESAKRTAAIHVILVEHSEFKGMQIKSEYLVDTKGVL